MINKIIILALVASSFTANAQFGKILEKAKGSASEMKRMTQDDNTADGLKAALNEGVTSAVNSLSVKNGYYASVYKILLPEDAIKIINAVKVVPGFQDVETKLTLRLNQAAELAATKATPIFVNAITNITIKDAKSILFGPVDAATRHLELGSRQLIYNEFTPVIKSSLDEVNASSYWKTVVDAYNKIPLQKKLNPSLEDHVANKALDGLFSLIQEKEKGIREDVNQRTTAILQDVFGKLVTK
jgi:hypothetical protein